MRRTTRNMARVMQGHATMQDESRALTIAGGPEATARGSRVFANKQASDVQMRVWIEARVFFSRAEAQQYCWLWLLAGDGRVHALRLLADRCGADDLVTRLLPQLCMEPELPPRGVTGSGTVLPLPGAPVVPLPRWSVSWGQPVQKALRALGGKLDAAVLDTLAWLETPGAFFGTVGNYNRLATLPAEIRDRRMQALRQFPALLASLLLDVYARPDMLGDDEDEPQRRACRDEEIPALLDAIDRGRDLIGALADYYRIGRALVRSPMFREPWADGCVPLEVLRLLDAIPAHARPRERSTLESRLPALRALPLRLRNAGNLQHLATAFARGWDRVWRELEARSPALVIELRDTRDFLRAALEQSELPAPLQAFGMEDLALAWLERRGLLSLLEASRRWHAQALVQSPIHDALPDSVEPILHRILPNLPGSIELRGLGRATELGTRADLIAEGECMHHCVGGYWNRIVLWNERILSLQLIDGSRATAQYRPEGDSDDARLALIELRGPCNEVPSARARALADLVEMVLNDELYLERRIAAAHDAAVLRAKANPADGPRATRPLDRRSRNELRRVLAWCARRAAASTPQDVLLRGCIAGVGYAEGANLIGQLSPGDTLQLAREPANPHDPRAVRIDWNGHKLGYVARARNSDIARRLDAGQPLRARISDIEQSDPEWPRVEFEVLPAP